MLKTGVFVWLTVNCKSLDFCSVDTLLWHNCIVTWMILFIANTRTVHTCRTATLHAVLSFLISLFASYDPQSHKILQFYYFQILLSKKVRGGHGSLPAPPRPHPRICRPCRCIKSTSNCIRYNCQKICS